MSCGAVFYTVSASFHPINEVQMKSYCVKCNRILNRVSKTVKDNMYKRHSKHRCSVCVGGRPYIRECTFEYTFIGLCKSELLSVNLGNHAVYSS